MVEKLAGSRIVLIQKTQKISRWGRFAVTRFRHRIGQPLLFSWVFLGIRLSLVSDIYYFQSVSAFDVPHIKVVLMH